MSIASVFGCVNWNDQRTPDGVGLVNDLVSGQAFNHTANDSDASLRFKFIALTLGTIPSAVIYRIPYRICDIICLNWVKVGLRRGQKEWNKYCITWIRDGNEGTPDVWIRRKIVVLSIMSELAHDVAKCVTYPLAAIALTFIAFFGLICPLDARKFYADIEDTWSLPKLYKRNEEVANYLAPCMQPKQVWDSRMLYDYKPNTNTGNLLTLENVISGSKCLEDIDYHPMEWMASVKTWRARYQELKDTLSQQAKLNIQGAITAQIQILQAITKVKVMWIQSKFLQHQAVATLEQTITSLNAKIAQVTAVMNTNLNLI